MLQLRFFLDWIAGINQCVLFLQTLCCSFWIKLSTVLFCCFRKSLYLSDFNLKQIFLFMFLLEINWSFDVCFFLQHRGQRCRWGDWGFACLLWATADSGESVSKDLYSWAWNDTAAHFRLECSTSLSLKKKNLCWFVYYSVNWIYSCYCSLATGNPDVHIPLGRIEWSGHANSGTTVLGVPWVLHLCKVILHTRVQSLESNCEIFDVSLNIPPYLFLTWFLSGTLRSGV